MPFLAAIPAAAYIAAGVSAAGTIASGIQKSNADKYNAQVTGNEQKAAIDQTNQQTNLVVRQGREAVGKQRAAFGGAGVGYGGSSETAMDQSAVNSELDALNTRYKGAITGYGYGTESGILKQQASDETTSSVLLAGAQAFNKISPYTGTPGGGT
jgi:hypothetical protein